MDKEELKKLADDPNNIPGIYNYCDPSAAPSPRAA
jgi:hypothetical protein